MSKSDKEPVVEPVVEPVTDIRVMGVHEWKIDNICTAAKRAGLSVLYIPDEYRYDFVDISLSSSMN